MKQLFTTTLLCLALMLNLAAQATLVKDINPGGWPSDETFYEAMPIGVWKGKAFFTANNDVNGKELWVSDGSEAGTKMLKDINPGAGDSNPLFFTVFNNKMYFAASGPSGRELWMSDGTEAGTVLFKDINPGSADGSPANLCVVDTILYFSARAFNASTGNSESELWKSNGTVQGTVQVADLPSFSSGSAPKRLVALGNKVCFVASTPAQGEELFISDGTSAGTKILKDINAGSFSSYPDVLRVVGNKLYFGATPENGSSNEDVWVSDGTPEGTQKLIPNKNILDVVNLNGKAIIGAGRDLYISDGSVQNTTILGTFSFLFSRNINHTRLMGVAGNLAYFAAEQSFNQGTELWVTDGTTGGTKIVADANYGIRPSNPNWLTPVGNKIFYAGDSGNYIQDIANGKELMETDGTEKGTKLLADIKTGEASSNPGPIVQLNENTLLFMAANNFYGRELWKYTLQTSTPTQEIRYTQSLFAFSPNPTQDQLQVRSLYTDLGDGVLRIHNLFGQLILQQPLRAQESRSVQLGNLPAGVYTLSLQQGDWMQVEKLLVE